MTFVSRTLCLLTVCLAPWNASAQTVDYAPRGGTQADYQALETIGEAWAEAYRTENLDALVDLYTDDAWVMARRQPARIGREEIREFFSSIIGMYELDVRFYMEELVVDGDFAHSIAKFALTYEPVDGSDPIDDFGRALILYQKGDDGQWRIWRDMDNVTPDAAGLSSDPG